ncbi:MAG: TIGR03364 family FAD-dependent oxidoreductase [Saprospiraceae bacterium]
MESGKYDIAIIGAGIVGLATALAAAKRGKKVAVFEKDSRALGASIRNFGMIWPIGQQSGDNLETAILSRAIWMDLAPKAKFWLRPNGSLHLAYHPLEKAVIEEFLDNSQDALYNIEWVDSDKAQELAKGLNPGNLLGALWSKTECLVNPREALLKITAFLEEKFNVDFFFNTFINEIEEGKIHGKDQYWTSDYTFICSGQEFSNLFPEAFEALPVKRCKLQMMKTYSQPANYNLGTSICGGLTLRHYDAFKNCPSLLDLDNLYDENEPEFKKYGIHVMVAQNDKGELIIGDSHEYGHEIEPFDKTKIDQLILKYLGSYFKAPKMEIAERWHGIYTKHMEGEKFIFEEVEKNVFAVNALGGAGMTISFGLMERLFNKFKF